MMNLGCIENMLLMEDYVVKNIRADYYNRDIGISKYENMPARRGRGQQYGETIGITVTLIKGDEIVTLDSSYPDIQSFAMDMVRFGEIVTKSEARGKK